MAETEFMRLSKKLSELGICSRREADDYISKGWILVNDKTAVLGQKVNSNDKITLAHNLKDRQDQKISVLIHKPVGIVSAQPEKDYQAAVSLLTPENYWHSKKNTPLKLKPMQLKGLAPAGRLDIDSTGLLILTQDGRIAKTIINHDSQIEKEYLVRVTGKLSAQGLALLNHGLVLDGEKLQPARVTWENEDQLKFILTQGKKRQIRRMCELVNLKVIQLKRVRIGQVVLGNLPLGKWRFLDKNEVF